MVNFGDNFVKTGENLEGTIDDVISMQTQSFSLRSDFDCNLKIFQLIWITLKQQLGVSTSESEPIMTD